MELAGRDGRIERATAAATLYATIIALLHLIQIVGNFAESEIGRWTNRKWHSVVHFHPVSLDSGMEFAMK